MKKFISENGAKDYRDTIITMYDELISIKVTSGLTSSEKDHIVKKFMRKVATHVLNCLGDEREVFVNAYMSKYHSKLSNLNKRDSPKSITNQRSPPLTKFA